MTDESYSFTAAKTRLDEIVTQVRKKDTSLEKSLDLLEEGVRLANVCTELIDHTDWVNTATGDAQPAGDEVPEGTADTASEVADAIDADAAPAPEADAVPKESDAEVDSASAAPKSEDAPGDVWSEDEAWADESGDDPSGGDEGYRE